MAFAQTTALEKLESMTRFYRVLQGGMSAGKTIAVLLYLINYLQTNREKLISVASGSAPQLRTGALRDFENILKAQNLMPFFDWQKTTNTFTYLPTDSQIEFIALDDETKARGARRDVLFVNEANRVGQATFDQMASRTREFVIIDFNPSWRFWAHDLVKKQANDTNFMIFTYRDNEALSEREVANIESHDRNSNWWRVYGEGQIGELENNIFKGWLPVDGLPADAVLQNFGLDFGFEHPTALTAIYRDSDGYIFSEKLYESHLTPTQIVAKVSALVGDNTVICDGARPEIIAQLRENKVRAIAANKDAGSVLRGIGQIQDFKSVRYLGKNIEREFLSYAWREKADGTKIEEPVKLNDDAMDSIRYAVDDLVAADKRQAAVDHDLAEYQKLSGNNADDDIFLHSFYK